jgi:hypothetical protein
VRRLKSPKTPQQAGPAMGSERRQTLYVHVELLKPGKGKRPVCEVEKLKTITKFYRVANLADETQRRANRARDKAIEAAVEIAFDCLYKLQDKGIAFKRVFISQLGDVQKAKRDLDALEYFHVTPKREKQPRLGQTLLEAVTILPNTRHPNPPSVR